MIRTPFGNKRHARHHDDLGYTALQRELEEKGCTGKTYTGNSWLLWTMPAEAK